MPRIPALLIAVSLLIFGNSSFAQFRKIPAEVTDAFKEKFPYSNAVEWKDKLKLFQANFEMKDEDYIARFNSKGVWQETEKMIEQDKLPATINESFNNSRFSDWEVKELSFIEKKDGSELYRILVKKNDIEKRNLFFTKEGKLLKDAITL